MSLPEQRLGVQYKVPAAKGTTDSFKGTSIPPGTVVLVRLLHETLLVVEIEFWVDYCCPFSSKMFLTLQKVWNCIDNRGDMDVIFVMQVCLFRAN